MNNFIKNIVYKIITLPISKYNTSNGKYNKKGIVSPKIYNYIDIYNKDNPTKISQCICYRTKYTTIHWNERYSEIGFFNNVYLTYKWNLKCFYEKMQSRRM